MVINRENPYNSVKDDIHWEGDDRSCCVVALMKVMDCSYKAAYDWCKNQGGRVHGRGMTLRQIEKMFVAMKNTKYVKGPYDESNRITVSQFLKRHPEGRFFCAHRGHVFAIVDGILHDHILKPRRQIIHAWRVYPSK